MTSDKILLQTVQQVEAYKGSNGAHFGPDATGGSELIL